MGHGAIIVAQQFGRDGIEVIVVEREVDLSRPRTSSSLNRQLDSLTDFAPQQSVGLGLAEQSSDFSITNREDVIPRLQSRPSCGRSFDHGDDLEPLLVGVVSAAQRDR